jgi:hypothetical protein
VDVASEEAVAKVAVDVAVTVKVAVVANVVATVPPAPHPLLLNDQVPYLISRLKFEGVIPCESFS